ncbi:MAG: pilus assembly protein TadG-related protein [Marmoricola sp.]
MRLPAARRTERGSVTPLILGFTAILLVLVAVVVDASAAFLRRQELDAVADAAALAATDGAQAEAVYLHGVGGRVEVDPAAARRYVAAYLDEVGAAARFPGLTVQVRTDAATVVVRLVGSVRLPLHVPGVGGVSRITGTAAAVVAVNR